MDARFKQSASTANRVLKDQEQTLKRLRAEQARAGESLLGALPGGARLTQFKAIADDLKTLTSAARTGEGAVGGLSGVVTALGGTTTLAAGGVAVLTAAAAGLALGVFKAVTSFSDYATHIHDLGVESGLTSETLSTVAAYAKLSGSSLDQAAGSLEIYLKNAAEAASGNKQLSATFKRFDIDATEALKNPDRAARQLFDKLASIQNPAERLDAAFKLAGRSGKTLALIAQEMGGNFSQAERAAREWGVVLGEDDVRAADKFSDAWDILGLKAQGVIFKIGRGALPELEGAINDVSGTLSGTGPSWEEFGKNAGKSIRDAIGFIKDLNSELNTVADFLDDISGGANPLTRGRYNARQRGVGLPPIDPNGPGARFGGQSGSTMPPTPATDSPFTPTFRYDEKPKREKARKDELDKLKAFVKEWDFIVKATTEGRHNKGSLHYIGRAADVSVKGKSAREIELFMEAARAAGYGVRDERTRPVRADGTLQKVWTAPHLHLEIQSKASQAMARETSAEWKRVASEMERASEQAFDAFVRGEEERRETVARSRQVIEDALSEQIALLRGEETQLERVNRLIAEQANVAPIDARTAAFARLVATLNDVKDAIPFADPFGPGAPLPEGPTVPFDGTAPRNVWADRARHQQLMRELADDVTHIYGRALDSVLDGWEGMWREMLDIARQTLLAISQEMVRTLLTGQQSGAGGLIGLGANFLSSLFGGGRGGGGGLGSAAGAQVLGAFGGSFDKGGYLAPGKFGYVHSDELVYGGRTGMTVFNREDTARALGGSGDKRVTINLIMPPARPADTVKTRLSQAEQMEGFFRRLLK